MLFYLTSEKIMRSGNGLFAPIPRLSRVKYYDKQSVLRQSAHTLIIIGEQYITITVIAIISVIIEYIDLTQCSISQ